MSLISDPDYLIHNLRLTYLRHIDDPYGPRIISLHPRYSNNPHVLAAGLADLDRWPELVVPISPQPTDDEGVAASNGRRHSGFPGATGLKYTQTIMGPSRVGGMGMRTSGKRSLTSKETPLPPLPNEAQTRRLRSDSAPTPVSSSPALVQQVSGSSETHDESLIQVSKRRSAGGSSLSDIPVSLVEGSEITAQAQLPKPHHPVDSLVHQREIEARKRNRIRARFSSTGNNVSRPAIIQNLNPEESSDDEVDPGENLPEYNEFEYLVEGNESIDADPEEFDPDFAPPQMGATSDTASDVISTTSISNSAFSTSHSSVFTSSLQVVQSARTRCRLSPVSEGRANDRPFVADGDDNASDTTTQSRAANASESYFEMVTPLPPLTKPADNQSSPHPSQRLSPPAIHTSAPPSEELTFPRRKIPPIRTAESALTTKLSSSSSTSSNPFTELYALISGRAQVASMTINVFFPHVRTPAGRALELDVRKDASVEEVLGYALWSYWEENWIPKLDEGLGGEDDPKRKTRLSATGWVLRIAEEDGEVDEDFPAPDRMGKISKFNFDAYAILEANPSQIAQNQQLESKIVRRPSRIIVAKKKPEPATLTPQPLPGPGTSAVSGSALGVSLGLSTSLGLSSSHGPQVLLRVKVADATDTAAHYSTTISVSAGMYMQEALELVCRKRKITNPNEWALLVSDPKTLIFLDRTVASLQGRSELELVQRSTLPQYGFHIDGDRRVGRTTDPNASIFKRMSEVPEVKFSQERDFSAAYKKYTVFRKLPMAVVRLERTLAIDGDYIYIIPSASKARAVFDSMKTTPYHIDSVITCTQSAISSSSFKFVVKRDGGDKRYDFEAETAKIANEIVTYIRGLKNSLDRSGTVNKSRRTRHVS